MEAADSHEVLTGEEELQAFHPAQPFEFPLDVNTVLTYFAKSVFYDSSCTNEQFRMQLNLVLLPFPSARIVFDSMTSTNKFNPNTLKEQQGMEYDVEQKGDQSLFTIRKQNRTRRPNGNFEVHALQLYYCVEGNIYPAPALSAVLNCRLLAVLHHLHEALSDSQKLRRYHPSAGYTWADGSNDNNIADVQEDTMGIDISETNTPTANEREDEEEEDIVQYRSAQSAALDQHVARLFQAIRQHYPLETKE
eukprot:CFRG7613T1